MAYWLSELLAALPLLGLVYLVWWAWGRAARKVGVGRLQLLGWAALIRALLNK